MVSDFHIYTTPPSMAKLATNYIINKKIIV
jgi:hypothetical protein